MSRLVVLYGSYRGDRAGMRLALYLTDGFRRRGAEVALVDAKSVGLPMLDRMFKEYAPGEAPEAMSRLAEVLRGADAFVFVAGEYNWGVQPGLKNLVDHYLEEWFWRPAAIATYSAGRLAGARAAFAWHPILAELGMVVSPHALAVGGIADALDEVGRPTGPSGEALQVAFPRFAATLEWWTEAAGAQRERRKPPY